GRGGGERPRGGGRAGSTGRGGGERGGLLRGARPAAGALRPPLPDARGDPRRRQPVQGGALGQSGSHDLLPAHEPARPAAQPAARLGKRVRASPERRNVFEASPPLTEPTPLGLDAPLAGVASALITAATPRVARRWRH